MSINSIHLDDIRKAAKRIFGHIEDTALVTSVDLNGALGFNLLIKAENEQTTGSFKIRGALNHMIQLSEAEKRRGVFAFSSGNHAQGVACAAQYVGISATILMPSDAPRVKIDNTRAYGAEVVLYERDKGDPETLGLEMARERGLHMIHPYDDVRTIAGQGTMGMEIRNQCRNWRIVPDAIIVPCSGGGLAAGIALTRDLYAVPPQLYTAEPEGFDDARRSLEAGEMVVNERGGSSICDALQAAKLGSLTLPLLKRHDTRGLAVTNEEAEGAMFVADDVFQMRLEPSGATALAAALRNREKLRGKTVVVVASGGNVDGPAFHAHRERGRHHTRKAWPFAL